MDYVLHVLVLVALYVILATSFNLLIGFAGLFALSHAAFFAMGAYATAILTTSLGWPFPFPLLVGMAVAAVVSMAVALPALRIGGDYLVIVSLALQMIAVAVMANWTSLTGGTDGIRGIPAVTLGGHALDTARSFLPLAAAVALACWLFAWRLGGSPFGRTLKAMRDDETAALSVGKNVVRMKLGVFALSAALASVAGSLYAHYMSFVSAEAFTLELTIGIMAMVIVGGTGNLRGSALGAALLVVLPELLKFVPLAPDVAEKLRLVLYGLILIVVLRLRPQGLLPERAITTPPPSSGGDGPQIAEVQAAALEGKGLGRRFGGIVAVQGLDIRIEPGQITGLIGPNGAGKTTAFNLLTGFIPPTEGSVSYRGESLTGRPAHRIVAMGVARSFQDLKLFRSLTLLDNVMTAFGHQSGDSLWKVYLLPGTVAAEERRNIARAMQLLRFVGLEQRAGDRAADLSYAEEKLLVVARLLATDAEVLLFDEPLSGLAPNTLDRIVPIFRQLAASGRTIAIIEHNLDVISELCDTAVFLDEGRKLAQAAPKALMADPVLAGRYFK